MTSSSSPPQTIKTRICIISDTHTHTPHPSSHTTKPYRHPLPSADVFLHAGDLTTTGRLPEHQLMISLLKQIPAELKLIIAGNHDITLDRQYYTERGASRHGSARMENVDEIKALYTNDEAQRAGIVYMEEEVRSFSLKNGAKFTVYASPYTPEFCGWAFAYRRDEDRFNLVEDSSTESLSRKGNTTTVPSFPDVDIMLTHGPPLGVLDQVVHGERVGCKHLLKACTRARPRLHVFGHIHEGFGAVRHNWTNNTSETIPVQDPETVQEQRSCYYNLSSGDDDNKKPLVFGEETLFVNASVMTVKYHADNAPWVVDLDLPVS